MNVLVTGANGYLGGHVVRVLRGRGHTVYGLNSHGKEVVGTKMPLQTVEAIVYLAWYSSAGDGHPGLQEDSLERFNDLMSTIGWACGKKLKKVLFASTASVYGDVGEREVSEIDPAPGNCAYTRAKVAAETRLRIELPSQHVIFRFGSMMGRGETRTKSELVVNAFAIGGFREKRIEVWNPDCWKPVIHVRDAAEIVAEAIEKGEWYGTVNVASANYQASALAYLAHQQTGGEVVVKKSPNGSRSCKLSCGRLRSWLPFGFAFRSVEDTIREFMHYVPTPFDVNIPWKG